MLTCLAHQITKHNNVELLNGIPVVLVSPGKNGFAKTIGKNTGATRAASPRPCFAWNETVQLEQAKLAQHGHTWTSLLTGQCSRCIYLMRLLWPLTPFLATRYDSIDHTLKGNSFCKFLLFQCLTLFMWQQIWPNRLIITGKTALWANRIKPMTWPTRACIAYLPSRTSILEKRKRHASTGHISQSQQILLQSVNLKINRKTC